MCKLKIKYPIICEGKYDKIKLDSVIDGYIITTQGFGIFNNEEKRMLLIRLAEKTPIIAVTDSDGGGGVIRSHLRSLIPPERLINLYIPRIKGNEKRKNAPSAEGFLGVEGMDADVIRKIFAPYAGDAPIQKGNLTKTDMYTLGLSGRENSEAARAEVCEKLHLPPMSANALLEALNMLYSDKEKILREIELS